jgi:hypothetical protein
MDRGHPPRQITISEFLWESLGKLAGGLGYKDGRGLRSRLGREMIAASIMKWRYSPYVCYSAQHVFFVTGCGHVLYRQVQVLKLNSKRERLPCILEMKPEKRKDFHDYRRREVEEAEWFRSRWLINYFAAWHGECIEGAPLSSHVDRDGIDCKMADLSVDQGANRHLTREIVVGVQDYIQWQDGGHGYDRVDVPIDVPTRNLKVFVIVDADLYRNTASEDEIPDLELEFRNRECARFEGGEIALDSENPIEKFFGRRLHGEQSAEIGSILERLDEMQQRIETLSHSEADNGTVMTEEGRETLRTIFKRPERFIFCTLEWPSPYFGIDVCVRWEKPVRLSGAGVEAGSTCVQSGLLAGDE